MASENVSKMVVQFDGKNRVRALLCDVTVVLNMSIFLREHKSANFGFCVVFCSLSPHKTPSYFPLTFTVNLKAKQLKFLTPTVISY